MKINMKALGATIAAARKRHDMTQVDLANALGVSQPRVAEWESGKVESMNLATYMTLSHILEEIDMADDALEPEPLFAVQDDAGTNIWTTFYRSLEQANDEADSAWARLTAYERKNRRIQVFETTDFDPYGGDGYDQPDGAFDSDNL